MLYTHEALSGISGSVSLACWLFVLVPQFFENYISKSADGISLAFLTVWLVTFPSGFCLIAVKQSLDLFRDSICTAKDSLMLIR